MFVTSSQDCKILVIDREAREIMHLVASVCLSVRPSVCPFVLSWLNRLIRGSALSSAAKSNKSHYQSKVFVCVSVIRGRILIIARMRSIGVLIQSKTGDDLVELEYRAVDPA